MTKGPEVVTSSTNSVGNGIFLSVDFSGHTLDSRVDTGATLTILSSRAWEASSLSRQCALEKYEGTFTSASGKPMAVKSKFRVTLGLDKDWYEADFVADTECDLMLALDFLKAQKCIVDFARNSLSLHGKMVDFNSYCLGLVGCFWVTTSRDIIIPPRSETPEPESEVSFHKSKRERRKPKLKD